jgi:dephospho-CoA kinase
MIVIGLTGSIAMGKSTVGKMLEYLGVPVHDSDQAVHRLLSEDTQTIQAIGGMFPGTVDAKTGMVDRAALGQIVFADPAKRKQLEDILHPRVREDQTDFILQSRQLGLKRVALDIPLLFETGADQRVDVVLVASAPAYIQRRRALARTGMTLEKFNYIKKSQLPDSEKRKRADYVIETGLGHAHSMTMLKHALHDIGEGT